MTITSLINSIIQNISAEIKGKTITFYDYASLLFFLTLLDDSKMSCQFGSLTYLKPESKISKASAQNGNIFKLAYVPIQTVTSYATKIINKLAKKGITKKFEEIDFKPTFWSKRHKNSILGIFNKTGEVKYLAYFPNGKPYDTVYFDRSKGRLIDQNEIDYIPSAFKKYGSSTQKDAGLELDEQVTPQILKLENLREVTINGYRIKYRP
jgi:hypothetical protein